MKITVVQKWSNGLGMLQEYEERTARIAKLREEFGREDDILQTATAALLEKKVRLSAFVLPHISCSFSYAEECVPQLAMPLSTRTEANACRRPKPLDSCAHAGGRCRAAGCRSCRRW